MTDAKLKCGSPGCDYITEDVRTEIAWGCCSSTGRTIMFNKGLAVEKGTNLGQKPVAIP